jgi:hypothetical protein
MSALAHGLRKCCESLDEPSGSNIGLLPDIKGVHDGLLSSISAQEAWVASLRKAHKPVAEMLKSAARTVQSALQDEAVRLTELTSALRLAKETVAEEDFPNTVLLVRMSEIQGGLKTAEKKENKSRRERDQAKEDLEGDHENEEILERCAVSEKGLQAARLDVRRLVSSLHEAWGDVFRLASAAYPELPCRVAKKLGSLGSSYLPYVDSFSAGLLDLSRRRNMYEEVTMISEGGVNSQNDVFRALYGGVEVCLKKFKMGNISKISGTSDDMLRSRVRTLQRELNTVARLEHPNIIKAQLFFLEEDDHGALSAYIEYPLYSGGSMNAWLEVAKQGEGAVHSIRTVLWDALKGLEHVHHHAVVHCDVKLANVSPKNPNSLFSHSQYLGLNEKTAFHYEKEKLVMELTTSVKLAGPRARERRAIPRDPG